MAAFESLRAEDEPWLPEVFEAPPEFDLIIGSRSAIIFGATGSGKTAVYQALALSSVTGEGKPKRLLVEWHPKPPKPGVEIDSYLVDQQINQLFDACALSLATHLAYYPDAFINAPTWAQGALVWFIRRYLQGDFELRTGSLSKEIGEAGRSLLIQLQTSSIRMALPDEAAPELVIVELVKVLAEVELTGAWVLVDRLETWSETEPERLAAGLTAFLSTLSLFEQNGFAYKMLLPASLAPFLSGVSGVARRRLDVHHLRWSKHKLEALVTKRLSLALGREINSLADICEDKMLSNWLERCGGDTPHGWLEYLRPLVAAYLDRQRRGRFEPVSTEEWHDIRRRHPPLLILDKQHERVMVGEREVKELSEGQYALLEYLYDRAGQVCSRSELYYRAARGLAYEPRAPSDPGWEAPKAYSGQLDTAIWRLREMIEPGYVDNNKDSLFIITVKGKGYRLENAYKGFG
jgi:hypothetical protein